MLEQPRQLRVEPLHDAVRLVLVVGVGVALLERRDAEALLVHLEPQLARALLGVFAAQAALDVLGLAGGDDHVRLLLLCTAAWLRLPGGQPPLELLEVECALAETLYRQAARSQEDAAKVDVQDGEETIGPFSVHRRQLGQRAQAGADGAARVAGHAGASGIQRDVGGLHQHVRPDDRVVRRCEAAHGEVLRQAVAVPVQHVVAVGDEQPPHRLPADVLPLLVEHVGHADADVELSRPGQCGLLVLERVPHELELLHLGIEVARIRALGAVSGARAARACGARTLEAAAR